MIPRQNTLEDFGRRCRDRKKWSQLKGTPLFMKSVLIEELPSHFQPYRLGEYTGTFDLENHLCHFKNASLLHQYSD